jgi:hypothetical protein
MPKIPSRPTNTSLVLPGTGNTTAHTGNASARLYTLDPLAARNEVLSAQADPLARAQALTTETAAAGQNTPVMAPRRALGKLLHGAARVMGFARGEPVAHEHLLRYAGTKLKHEASRAEAPGGVQKTLSSFISKLAAEQHAMDARIACNEVAAVAEVVAGHLERTKGDLALSARRATALADRASELSQRGVAVAAQLATVREEISLTSDVLACIREALARERPASGRPGEAPPAQPPAGTGTGMSPLRDLLSAQLEHDQREAAWSNVAMLEEVLADKSRALAGLRSSERALLQRQQELQAGIASTQRVAGANERDLWSHDRAAEGLRARQEPLQRVGQAREGEETAAAAQAREARASFADVEAARCGELLDLCPGFAGAGDLQPLRDAVRGWSETLQERLARFGGEALPRSLAVHIAFEALSVATGGHALQAAELMHRLQENELSAVIPHPGGAATAAEPAQRLARLLADEGCGIQMLQLLLKPGRAPLSQMQAEAARQYLLAGEAALRLREGDTAQREWMAMAQRAAAGVTHAGDPVQALAACTADERAAYRAFRNGYDSTTQGSDYDKANQHLKKPLRWLTERAAAKARPAALAPLNPMNPLDALKQGMAVGAATALPTPARQAAKALTQAADHLHDYLVARDGLLPQGHMPSPGELGFRALAHHMRWLPEGTDPTTMKLDERALRSIDQHRDELQQFFEREVRAKAGGQPLATSLNAPLDAAWKALRSGRYTVLQAMDMLHKALPAAPGPRDPAGSPAPTDVHANESHWRDMEARTSGLLHDAVAEAHRLLRDGKPEQVDSARALFDMTRDMIENLEWRDRLRLTGQKAWGLNTSPLSVAVATAKLATGVGLKLIAGGQRNSEQVMEIYMGRTGLYLQLGEQQVLQGQLGAGVNVGYMWGLGDEQDGARAGIGSSADWKVRRETALESGVQLRVLRLSKGEEPQLMAKFMDVYEHLMTLTDRARRGEPVPDDWMRELLAHHDNLNIGLIDQAARSTVGTEFNWSIFAGARTGEVDGRPRRVNLSISGGIKARQDRSSTQTEVAGYMTTLYRDSTAQAKVEGNVRATAGALLKQWSELDEKGRLQPKASLGAGGADLAYAAEVKAEGITRFCTLFTIDRKIDPVRSDCAMDFLDFAAFEREVRRDWNTWVNYGTAKLPADMSAGMRHAVAERQLEDLLEQGRNFAAGNKFATVYMDKALKAEAAPVLDGLRALAGLQRKGGREQEAQQTERLFDDTIAQPPLWEPTILLLREKTKGETDRGVDFFLKWQNNRIAEAMRTVGQWPLYEPVPRAEPGRKPEPARLWQAEG